MFNRKYNVCFKLLSAPPLTSDNILKAVQGMTWKRLAEVLLHTGYSQSHFKVDEIKGERKSNSDRLHDVIEHWLQGDGKDSRPSWRTLIWRLDNENETRVADSIRQFAEPVLGKSCDFIIYTPRSVLYGHLYILLGF